jgi:hypothetical protein
MLFGWMGFRVLPVGIGQSGIRASGGTVVPAQLDGRRGETAKILDARMFMRILHLAPVP